jgi:hypothetical protein
MPHWALPTRDGFDPFCAGFFFKTVWRFLNKPHPYFKFPDLINRNMRFTSIGEATHLLRDFDEL